MSYKYDYILGVAAIKSKMVFVGLGLMATCVLLLFWAARSGLRLDISLPGHLNSAESEHRAESTCTIKDQKGVPVTRVSRKVWPGDEVITREGKHYRVLKSGSTTAVARLIGMDRELASYSEQFKRTALPVASPAWSRRPVAIYHTHTDESYLPSDGRISIPFKGGIIQVGSTYKAGLSREGARVLHDKTPHDPHDNNAYYRSRRTAVQLLKKSPIALFDVHRDGIDDPEFYRESIANRNVAQIRIVIGRQNPNMAANLDFAKRMMAYANNIHPGIVKEIFMATGNYNQDLLSTAVLLEAGTYTNRKEEAMKGVDFLAEAVPVMLGITGAPDRPFGEPVAPQSGIWPALLLIIVLTLLGGGAFLLVNVENLDEVKKRLSDFYRNELPGVLTPLVKKIPLEQWWKIVKEKTKIR